MTNLQKMLGEFGAQGKSVSDSLRKVTSGAMVLAFGLDRAVDSSEGLLSALKQTTQDQPR